MVCKCGGSMRQHQYETVDKVVHEVHTCPGCGRRHEVLFKRVVDGLRLLGRKG